MDKNRLVPPAAASVSPAKKKELSFVAQVFKQQEEPQKPMSISELLQHSERLKGLIEKITDLEQKAEFNQHVIFKLSKKFKQNEFITTT